MRIRIAAILAVVGALLIAFGSADAGVGVMRATGSSQYVPTWSWDFRGGTMPSGSTFARASSRSCFNSSGVMVTLSSNVPCYDYDPSTLAPRGYLSEMQSTNALTYSTPDTTHWGGSSAGTGTSPVVTVNDAGTVAPDGTTTATKVVFNAGAGTTTSDQSILASPNISIVSGSTYGGSIYAKAAVGTKMLLRNFGNPYVLWTATGGWDRISSIDTAGGTGSSTLDVGVRQGIFGTINATATVWLWGAQFESAGVGVTSLIPTAGATATRAADALSLPLASLPGWKASVGGVIVLTHRRYTNAPTAASIGFRIYETTANNNNIIQLYAQNTNGQTGINWTSGGVSQVDTDNGAPAGLFTRSKLGLSWGPSRAAVFKDGAINTGGVTGTFTLPANLATIGIGNSAPGSQNDNSANEGIAYFVGARSDAFAKQVTK